MQGREAVRQGMGQPTGSVLNSSIQGLSGYNPGYQANVVTGADGLQYEITD